MLDSEAKKKDEINANTWNLQLVGGICNFSFTSDPFSAYEKLI